MEISKSDRNKIKNKPSAKCHFHCIMRTRYYSPPFLWVFVTPTEFRLLYRSALLQFCSPPLLLALFVKSIRGTDRRVHCRLSAALISAGIWGLRVKTGLQQPFRHTTTTWPSYTHRFPAVAAAFTQTKPSPNYRQASKMVIVIQCQGSAQKSRGINN